MRVQEDLRDALGHAERGQRPAREDAGRQRLHCRRRGGEHADRARGRARVPRRRDRLRGPGKAATANGVATSALEMQQNARRDSWSFDFTEKKLDGIHAATCETARELVVPGNYVVGANVARFDCAGSSLVSRRTVT